MPDFLVSVFDFINDTQVLDQIRDVQYKELFQNPYFLVPFISLVGYWIYKKAVNSLIFLALGVGLWAFSGSYYMQDLIVGGELSLEKVLPVAGVGMGAIGVIIYVVFVRGD